MRKNIHPKYYENAKIACACGNIITAGSTVESGSTDICSNCHPFFTGKANIVDTAGVVEKFKARTTKAVENYKTKKKEKTIEKKEAKKKKGIKIEDK